MNKIFEYFVWRGVPALLNVISIIVLSKKFGPEVFGLYSIFFATIVFTKTASLNWITFSAQRFHYEDEASTIGASAAMSLIALLPAFLLFFLILPENLHQMQFLIFAAIILQLEAWFELSLVHSRLIFEARRYGFLLLGRAVIYLGVGIILSLFTASIFALIAALFLGLIIPVSMAARRTLRDMSPNAARRKLGQFLKFGVPVSIATAFSMQFMLVVKYAILSTYDAATVGAFAVTSDIIQNGFFVLMLTVTLGLHPRATKAYTNGETDAVRRNIKQLILVLGVVALVLVIMVISVRPLAPIVLSGVFLDMFLEISIPLSIIFSLAILKVGILDFVLGLRQQTLLQIGLSSIMIGAIYLVMRFSPSDDMTSLMYQICVVMAIVVAVQTIICSKIKGKS